MSLNLKKTIEYLRRQDAHQDQIYLILALIEVDAPQAPFFPDEKDIFCLKHILESLIYFEAKFIKHYLEDYDVADFPEYLCSRDEFKCFVEDFKEVLEKIKSQGEENYEFTRFDKMDYGKPESQKSSGTGSQG